MRKQFFFKVTDCSMVELQQYISAVTYDPSAHTTRCSYRWLQLHKENLVGRRTDNRNTRGRKETKTEFVGVLLPLRGKVIKQKPCEINYILILLSADTNYVSYKIHNYCKSYEIMYELKTFTTYFPFQIILYL